VHDDAHTSALFVRFFGGLRVVCAWLRERLETFAAHLLSA
jgi:hypothetical protein